MKQNALFCAVVGVLTAACAVPAAAEDGRMDFNGGIGSQPFAFVKGLIAPNDVRGIAPGGRPWVIGRLRATVRPDGDISVKGEGLVLAGGDSVGRPALPRQVVATLLCGAAQFTSPPVDLDASGNFVIQGALPGVLPNPCATPTLLIRNFSAGAANAWFAAGIPEN